MSVTTHPRPRSPFRTDAASDEIVRVRTDDGLSRALRDSAGVGDPIGGSFVKLSRGKGEEGPNCEESGNPDIDDKFEATSVAKRRKLEEPASSGNAALSVSPAKNKRTGTGRRIQGRLQNMLSLPFDVLYLIFSELEPIDLVNLARTSKSLRQVLMSRTSIWAWKVARKNSGILTIPEPPEDMSEPAWAVLLFGSSVCSHCNTKKVHRADFSLRRHLCAACRKKNLIPSYKFRSQCLGLKESVMELVPYTKRGGWRCRSVFGGRFYWKPDLYEMSKKLEELEADRDAATPGAEQRLASFLAERKLEVASIIQRSIELEKWDKEEAEAQSRSARVRRSQRHQDLRERILAAGYEDADITWIGMYRLPGANVDKGLTEEIWRRIRSQVMFKLSRAREDRLREEKRRREKEYTTKTERYYSLILRLILPVQRLYLPALSQVGELSCFRELRNLNRDVHPAEWTQAAGQLRQSLSEWMTGNRDRCTQLLPSYFASYETPSQAMNISLLLKPSINHCRSETMVYFAGQLELVTSVFRHRTTDTILIGRDVCHAWKMGGEVEFVERGAAASHALVRELKLDPATTTVSKLEQLNKLFICASCPAGFEWLYRSWRHCVLHFIACSETSHPSPQWQVVSTDEVWDPTRPEKETWLCNHCPFYLAPSPPVTFGRSLKMGTRLDAKLHVLTKHNIYDPIVGVDIFSYPLFE